MWTVLGRPISNISLVFTPSHVSISLMKSVLEDVPFFSTLNDYMTSASSARALDAGAIIGIVFGSVIGFVIFVFIVVACFIGCTVGFGVLVGGGGR